MTIVNILTRLAGADQISNFKSINSVFRDEKSEFLRKNWHTDSDARVGRAKVDSDRSLVSFLDHFDVGNLVTIR